MKTSLRIFLKKSLLQNKNWTIKYSALVKQIWRVIIWKLLGHWIYLLTKSKVLLPQSAIRVPVTAVWTFVIESFLFAKAAGQGWGGQKIHQDEQELRIEPNGMELVLDSPELVLGGGEGAIWIPTQVHPSDKHEYTKNTGTMKNVFYLNQIRLWSGVKPDPLFTRFSFEEKVWR